MKQDCVICPTCQGAGKIAVTGVYAETLRIFRRICQCGSDYVTAGRDAGLFRCNGTALNNRLSWLEKHGLAVSVKYGRERRFRPVAWMKEGSNA